MKRLIPAAIILICTVSVCIFSYTYTERECQNTLKEIELYKNDEITADKLESLWQTRKEKMSVFINRDFLDKISVYIGQLTAVDITSGKFCEIYKNIETLLSMIKNEQSFALHSFF